MSTTSDKIIQVAKSYVGQTEKPGNSGFVDPAFEKKMIANGWQKGWAWCVFQAKLIWKDAYSVINPLMVQELDKLFTPSAVLTFQKFKKSASWQVSAVPVAGALVFWEHGNTGTGHAAVVIQVNADGTFKTVEGNTNSDGSREGVATEIKSRKVNKTFSKTDLNVLGFVLPK
jgi:hypothetical protein